MQQIGADRACRVPERAQRPPRKARKSGVVVTVPNTTPVNRHSRNDQASTRNTITATVAGAAEGSVRNRSSATGAAASPRASA